MSFYTSSVRPLLFKLPPERAQRLAEKSLVAGSFWRAVSRLEDKRLHTVVAGIQFPNPIGLAAGYDKDCLFLPRLGNLGFGYVVGGTVLADPNDGNEYPRIVRDPKDGALVNSQGLPSSGVDRVARNLERDEGNRVLRIFSIAGFSIEDFIRCYLKLNPLSVGIELNISCPNADGAREFQDPGELGRLLLRLKKEKVGPLFVKLPPYFGDDQMRDAFKLVDVCREHGVEGVTVSNTHPRKDVRLGKRSGGLSGRPLLPHTLRMVADIRNHAGDDLVINGSGGISTGEDALQVLHAGANTLQIYTGFIYGGPRTIKRIKRYLLDHMEREGISSLSELTGRASRDLRVAVSPSANVSTPAA